MLRSHAYLFPHPHNPFLLITLFSFSSFLSLYIISSPLVSLHINTQNPNCYIHPLFSFPHTTFTMNTICAEQQQQHKFHSSHQPLSPKKHLREIDIPPRKFLTRRSTTADMFSDETILQKFLPHNDSDSDSDSDDPYSSDHFRMYEFKVRRCTRSRSHDWTDCPFSHPGEKARRRDPRRYHYSGTVCPEYRRGGCSRGDTCEFAHGVFESWLHPARYRTEACKDGKNCKRKVCFFAHTPRQLRSLPATSSSNSNEQLTCNKKNVNKLLNNQNHNHGSRSNNNCCMFCHCGGNGGANSNNNNTNINSIASPTSTLYGMSHFSPPASPPLSPLKPRNGVSLSPYGGMSSHQYHRYKDMLAELLGSFEGLNFNDQIQSSPPLSEAQNLSWFNVAEEQLQQQQKQQQFIVSNSNSSSFNCKNQLQKQQLNNNIVLPTVTTHQNTTTSFNNSNKLLMNDDNKVVVGDVNGWSCPTPDLGWVNELLM